MSDDIKSLEADQKKLDNIFDTLLESHGQRIARISAQNKGPTAPEMAKIIYTSLPEYHHMLLKSKQGQKLGDHDGVYVSYASVPKGSTELEALNAKWNPMFSITEAKGHSWYADGPSPAKVKIEMFRGSGPHGFRAKTGTPDAIMKYLVHYFKQGQAEMIP